MGKAQMIQIRGIGRWTAEMFLIFNLLRPNVLPLDDLGLLKGISISYFSGEPVSRSDAREVAANWDRGAPWRPGICGAAWTRCPPIIDPRGRGRRHCWCILPSSQELKANRYIRDHRAATRTGPAFSPILAA